MDNLYEAHRNARKDKLFYQEVKMVDANPEMYLKQIQEMLVTETYTVSPYSISIINDKGKERELAKLPYFPDRIIQWAVMLQIEHIFMEVFCSHTCASIKNRGISKAQSLLHKYMKENPSGTQFALQMDISKFYSSINHTILKNLLRRKFKDRQLLNLLDKIIDSFPQQLGVPIGSYLSQYLANYYLAYFDHWMKEELHLRYIVRYMDDIIVLSDSKNHLHFVRKEVEKYLYDNLSLSVKGNWQVYPVDIRGIDFIGFRSFHQYTLLRKRTCIKFKRKMNKIKERQNKTQLINYSEWCSANSYCGWLDMCHGYRLKQKYIKPILPSLLRYYFEVVLHCKHSRATKISIKRYKKKLLRKGLICNERYGY